MSVECSRIIHIMERMAPPQLAESWDNTGLIIGRGNAVITKMLIALDATGEVVDEAVKLGAELIITHHPIIFKPLARINDSAPLERKILKLIENKIAVYSAHTNLDIAYGGTNDELAKCIGLNNIGPLLIVNGPPDDENIFAIGRRGTLEKAVTLEEFAGKVKEKLGLDSIRFVGNPDKPIKTIGLSTGSASNYKNFEEAVKNGCDVFVTGDIRFHEAQEALAMGLALVDATHYGSENLVVSRISGYLKAAFAEEDIVVDIIESSVDGQVFKNR